jgi:hypothetical protein
VERELKIGLRNITDNAFVFAWGVILISLWTYTPDLMLSGIIAGAFGWYVSTKIGGHFFAVVLASVLGFIIYAVNSIG